MYFMADFTVGTMADLVGFKKLVHSPDTYKKKNHPCLMVSLSLLAQLP
jgi:hypothetical protein